MNFRNLIASGSRLGRRFCATVSSPASAGVEAYASAPTAASRQREIYNKLSKLSVTEGTVPETLNQFIMEGITLRKHDLFRCAKLLRKFRRYQHALEIFEWMEMRKMAVSASDHAIRLDLIAKTRGLEAAENYFNKLEPCAKNHQSTYGALMNCYCVQLQEEKAKAHFEKMDELKFVNNSLPFSNMMSMYMRMSQPEKVPVVVDAMKQRGISPCRVTYSIWMQSCASSNDFDGLEKIIAEMGKDSEAKTTWNTFSNLAAIYTKAGLFEEAESALKSMEEKMNPNNRDAHHFLISLYAGISKASEVNRVWESLKKAHPEINNMSYLVMLQALSSLGDVDGIKRIFTEWESKCQVYDMRLANIAINTYLKGNLYQEAETILDGAMKKCKGPFSKARQLLMIHLLENGKVDSAMKHLEAAVSDSADIRDHWGWSSELLSLFFLHFEKAKDVDGAEKLCRILSHWRPFMDSETVTFLIKTYAAAGKIYPDMLERLYRNEMEVSEDIQDLLEKVCP
ncbi:pentatricopeptide repeat-containing protein At1g02370, mitochondrial isoform X2 [Eutrema salsugineum]|uniref:pentatricopeptide repeat-containing protein At1g02370, mitochondrial isoform X2 n=1 Tax=Eutrema salsugineum TaxID=72664 RepID=UPI000CED0FA2|nr:pentatricopeptide repeat-containing protein At1g02370, mitochondrial isoform X2 [Eutrema salsugineum]